jgi:signal transduction histidine kinase
VTAVETAGIEISLVSSDLELKRLLREVLDEIREPQCCLKFANPEDSEPKADLWLWDYEPGDPLPVSGFLASRHLFLVNRKNVAEFREATAPADANILLKPVTRNTLRASVGLAVAAHWERVSASSSLREDRDELLQCLIQTSLRLQEYDHQRMAFLARAVHDFRAPLTAVNGYCGLLLGEHLGALNDTQKEVLQRMQHSARRLSRMASAMFELSVGRHIKRCPQLLPNDIRETLDQALHEIMTFADEKRIAITTDLAACDFPLYFEAGQIEQVLVNILDNACKFTPRAGMIEVFGYTHFWERRSAGSAMRPTVERRHVSRNEPNCYRIDIQDSGAPIPPEHLHRIFEEYTSYDGGSDRSGGGLGLAIAHMIMTQHDGHVWAENTAFGPRFSLVLPKRHTVDNNASHN